MNEINLREYEKLDYPTELFKKNGRWFIRFPDLPGCIADGNTREEAIAAGDEAKALWLETALETGREIPEPSEAVSYSGKLVLRLPRSLHEAAAKAAQREAVSLNSYLIQVVAEGIQRSGFKSLLSDIGAKLPKGVRGVSVRGGRLHRPQSHVAVSSKALKGR